MNANVSLLDSSEDELKADFTHGKKGPIAMKLMSSMRKQTEKSTESKESIITNYTYDCNKDYFIDKVSDVSSFVLDNDSEDNSFRSSIDNDDVSTENIFIYSSE